MAIDVVKSIGYKRKAIDLYHNEQLFIMVTTSTGMTPEMLNRFLVQDKQYEIMRFKKAGPNPTETEERESEKPIICRRAKKSDMDRINGKYLPDMKNHAARKKECINGYLRRLAYDDGSGLVPLVQETTPKPQQIT